MPRDDDSFWLDIFRKNPLIASIMFIGCVIGGSACLVPWFFSEFIDTRLALYSILIGAVIGGFVGLTIGVPIDTLVNSLRGDEKKKRRDQR